MKLGIVNMFLLLLIILISGSYLGNIVQEGMSSSARTNAIGAFEIAKNGHSGRFDANTRHDMDEYIHTRNMNRETDPNQPASNYQDRGSSQRGSSNTRDNSWLTPIYNKWGSNTPMQPQGIPKHQIPLDKLHLYIPKSMVPPPPICPTCPSKICKPLICEACPKCETCDEKKIRCKKVPNYSASNVNKFLPRSMVSDFSEI